MFAFAGKANSLYYSGHYYGLYLNGLKHQSGLKNLLQNKHFCLFCRSVSDETNKFCNWFRYH
jgi:hypothetical protein